MNAALTMKMAKTLPKLKSTKSLASTPANYGTEYADAIVSEYKFAEFYKAGELLRRENAVGIGVCLYTLKEVSPKDSTFKAKIRVQMKWEVEGIGALRKEGEEFRTMLFTSKAEMSQCMSGFNLIKMTPNITVDPPIDLLLPEFSTNQVEGTVEQWYAYLDAEDAADVVTLQYVENGTYAMLASSAAAFPFDVQNADFKFRLWDTKRYKPRFYQPLKKPDGTYYLKVFKMDVFLHDFVITKPKLVIMRGSDNEACEFVVSPQLRRKASYFFRHILLRLTLVSSLSLGAFAAPLTNIEVRTNIVLTLLLTTVTFSFTIQEDLPRLRQYTWMDVFVYVHFGLIITVAVEACVLFYLNRENFAPLEDLERADEVAFYSLASIWGVYNIFLLLRFSIHSAGLKGLKGDMIGIDIDARRKEALRGVDTSGRPAGAGHDIQISGSGDLSANEEQDLEDSIESQL